MTRLPLPRPLAYGLALAGVVLATVIRLALDPVLGPNYPFVTYFVTVLLTAWACGLGPSILALGLGSLAALFFFLPPFASFSRPDAVQLTGLLLYLFVGTVGIAIGEAERRARRRLEIEVAERQRAEAALREGEDHYRHAVELNPQVPWTADPDGLLIDFSPRWLELTGLTREEALGDGWWRAQHPDDRPSMAEAWSRSLRTGAPYDVEHRLRLAGGEFRWMRTRASPRRDRAGRVVRWYGTTEDVQDRKAAEERLRESEATLRAFYDHSPVCMGVVEPTGDGDVLHLYDNPATCRFFGVEPGSTAGRLASDLQADPDVVGLWLARYRESEQSGGPVRFEHHYRTPDGPRWLSVTVSTIGPGPTPCTRFCYVAEDVTERRRLSEQLEAERNLLDALFASTPVGLGFVDADFRFRRVNRAVAETNGVPVEAHLGRTMAEVLPDLWPTLEPLYRKVLETGEPVRNLEVEGETPKGAGARQSWLANYYPVRLGGAVIGVGFTVVETTEARLREARLREAEERFRASQEASLYGFTILRSVRDDSGRIVDFRWEYVNPAAAAILKRPVDELLGRRLLKVLPGNRDASELFEGYVRVVETGQPHEIEVRYDSEGIAGWFRNMAVRLGDGIAVSFSDITDRKAAEERLRESEERFRVMADNSPIMIWVTDAEGGVQFVNRAYREYFGVTPEQVAGPNWRPLVHPDDGPEYVASYLESLRARRPWTGQARVRRGDGQWRWVESRSAPRFSPSREFLGSVGSSADVTERRRHEEELREADRRKDEFLAMLAHELRNPLAPILNAVSVMALAEDDREAQRWSREVIGRQVRHLSSLVDDLLDLGRITQGKIKLERAPLAIGTFLGAAVEASRPLIDARGHRLDVSLPDEALRVEGDPTRLAQVVSNLLNNAAKYTPAGGHIRLSVGRDGDRAVISVRDDGAGIPAEMLPRVFDLFAQADRTLDRSEGGLGIGLTLVRRLVEMHGGTVEARSDGPGRGSEFVVRLPLLRDEAAAPPPGGRSAEPGRPRRILVVDDSRDSADTLARLLRRLGHEVAVAYDGPSACEAAVALAPDVVLLDLGLPGMDGYEVARRLRAEPPFDGVYLVALTGYGSASDRRRSEQAGFDAHLVKPVDLDALRRVLEATQVGSSSGSDRGGRGPSPRGS